MSMNAIKDAQPIDNLYAFSISKLIIRQLEEKLNVKCSTLGSTGKKPDDSVSGDIDIGIEMEMTSENVNKLKDFLMKYFKHNMAETPEFRELPGLNILSVGYHYEFGILRIPKIVQIDFMFTDNLEYTKFIFHSPNYRKKESNFKGLYRTNLLTHIVDIIKREKEPLYDIDGHCTDYWKYTLSFNRGLKLTHKSYISPKTGKLLKNPYTVKEDDVIISKNPEEIITFLFGNKVNVKDFNSFESIIDFLFSDRFIHSKITVREIIMNFINDTRHEEKREELIKYITNVLMNIFAKDMGTDILDTLLLVYIKDDVYEIMRRTAEETKAMFENK